ncbi:hypothetical protein MKW98_013616 [Papaver atlanticum]|uniref:ADP/ATP translocase n=1 Tax=Papaver atlanticum TaxID=357466 RepID=A0AAD4X621_9MAGN|nr:hypothetical protein MKW98_013616 [Papaver atlanticum]
MKFKDGTWLLLVYCGFNISCVGIIVFCGLYFGLYDSLKPVLLNGDLADSFLLLHMLVLDMFSRPICIVGQVESQDGKVGKVGMTVESDLKVAQLQHQLPANEPGALIPLVEGTTGEDNISLSVKVSV